MLSLIEGLKKCSVKYGFSYEEALLECKKEKVCIKLPYIKGVISSGCLGLEYNTGLYTQCGRIVGGSSSYCKICVKSMLDGTPICGNVSMRESCELMEYRDLKGKANAIHKVFRKQIIDIGKRDRICKIM